jgi:SWI/SNF-related matrix-associated actin-dependent regulator of chromatin subfamily A-like protein 1
VKLFPYQDEGARWLAGKRRALLGDGMRCGKTPQSIVAADMIGAHSILVVCPGIARQNWAREFDAFSLYGRPVAVVMSKDDLIEPNGVTILSMDGSRNAALHARVMEHRWDVLIIDEGHFLKEPNSQRTKQVCSAKGFAARADRIWFLTGTPMLNHPAELWVTMRTCGATKDDYETFMNRFCKWFMGDYGPVIKGMKNIEELKALLKPIMLRRTYHGMFPETPQPTWYDIELDPKHIHPDDLRDMEKLEDHPAFGRRIREWFTRMNAGDDVDISDCIPKSNFAELRHATGFAKIRPTAAWLREQLVTQAIDKIVVFGHHNKTLEILEADLHPFGAASIYGATKDTERQKRIDRFNREPERRVLCVQDQIGRTAIDLTGAHHLLFAELDPVPENNAQAAMRVQGPRQTKPVHIHVARLPNSTDDMLTRILAKKSQMASELFD